MVTTALTIVGLVVGAAVLAFGGWAFWWLFLKRWPREPYR